MTTEKITLVSKTNSRDIPVPSSYCELLSSVSVFHPSKSCLKFKTSAGQMKPMASDLDFYEALQGGSINFVVSSDEEITSFPSTPDILSVDEDYEQGKSDADICDGDAAASPYEMESRASLSASGLLPIHLGVTCDGCGIAPMCGNRYKCAVCVNFDYCEACWNYNRHGHAFYRITNPENIGHAEIVSTDVASFPMVHRAAENLLKKPEKLKLEYESDGIILEGHTVFAGNQVKKSWHVRNTGKTQWPTGCYITCVMGDLKVDTGLLPPLRPGEPQEVSIHFQVPPVSGLKSYAFRAVSPEGKLFGEKLHMTIRIEFRPF